MSDELEQTIEELEAEVLAELEEASEKPLGKAKDLGLGSDNAGDDVSNASKPAAKQLGQKVQIPLRVRKLKTSVVLNQKQK